MKTLAVLVLLSLPAIPGCATCKAEKNAVAEIEKTQAIMDSEYLRYTDHDPLLTPEQKDNRRKLVESRQRLLDKLKKSLE